MKGMVLVRHLGFDRNKRIRHNRSIRKRIAKKNHVELGGMIIVSSRIDSDCIRSTVDQVTVLTFFRQCHNRKGEKAIAKCMITACVAHFRRIEDSIRIMTIHLPSIDKDLYATAIAHIYPHRVIQAERID